MSVINHELGHVFIHVPKTAGTSMERLPFVGGNGHQTARELIQHQAKDYFSWGFVRNPFDRILSAYHSLKANKSHSTPDVDKLSFDEWIASGAESRTSLFWTYAHTQPMAYYLCDDNSKVLVDYVGRFESLAQSWVSICEKLNCESQTLPKVNVAAKRPHWSTFYNNATTKQRVKDIYKTDFDIFNYDY